MRYHGICALVHIYLALPSPTHRFSSTSLTTGLTHFSMSDKQQYTPLIEGKDSFHDDLSATTTEYGDIDLLPKRRTPRWKSPFCLHAIFLLAHFIMLTVFTLLLLEKFTFHVCKPQPQKPPQTHPLSQTGSGSYSIKAPTGLPNHQRGGPDQWLISCT